MYSVMYWLLIFDLRGRLRRSQLWFFRQAQTRGGVRSLSLGLRQTPQQCDNENDERRGDVETGHWESGHELVMI